MTRLTRQQAAVRLGVSESTVDRMIRRGQLATEREYHGGRYTVWVLVDDETAYSSADETAQAELSSEGNSAYAKQPDADNSAYSDEQTAYPSGDKLAVLRTENQALRELSDYHRKLLDESEWRYRELLEQLKQTTAALSRALPETVETAPPRRRRWWFW